ncbi:FtsQ-type POTRA domain-containing protein [Corticibacter populi]|uniref:Cell division protein FtsQ n=1 Tax=Corticibacter populi TaxID=1550736 RepID=A0A3M6QLZ2_9BURK|nr:cell division protein FtsQ/DivIB [Corticibacter populi]RMX04054.1 FtsQ-type POTRA domain-containing protein [Corticibacter populi]RZS33055.1 cell division protein FtsQ [Corticibacter populi]
MTQTLPPMDVRLMNATASVVFTGVFLLLCAAAVGWALRNPAFAIARVEVFGNPQHSNALALRANVLPQLQGNLFTLNLAAARQAFEQMPWVRSATLRRAFPNTLQVQLEEHQPVALWEDETGSAMVNSFGEVFEANRGEVEHENLPRLAGPQEQSAQVLAMYRDLLPQFAGLPVHPAALYLTPRGNWQMYLSNGAQLELGAGEPVEVGQRLAHFLQSLPEALAPLGRSMNGLEYADLRHGNGYAMRLRGVVTDATQGPQRGARR